MFWLQDGDQAEKIKPETPTEKAYKYYSKNSQSFPWQWFGGVPQYGSVHSYLCDILLPLIEPRYQIFMSGHPSLGELKRMADRMNEDNWDTNVKDIISYCDRLIDNGSRKSRELAVFDFLFSNDDFVKFFKKKIEDELQKGYKS